MTAARQLRESGLQQSEFAFTLAARDEIIGRLQERLERSTDETIEKTEALSVSQATLGQVMSDLKDMQHRESQLHMERDRWERTDNDLILIVQQQQLRGCTPQTPTTVSST